MFHWKSFFAVASVCFILVVLALDPSNAWRRRRRRRYIPRLPHDSWVNNWDAAFTFQCHSGHSISRLRSIHSNHHEDRRWAFSCYRNSKQSHRCHWTNYNAYDAYINQICPYYGFIAGVKSHHHNQKEDRQYSFKCCDAIKYVWQKCHWTSWKNGWDQELHFHIPHRYNLRGVRSVHNNGKEDRLWAFYLCQKKHYG